jgi:hypothetical protein
MTILSFGIVLTLQFAFPFRIWGDLLLMGKLSPTYFHNGTLSLSMPLALFLFRNTASFLEKKGSLQVRPMLYLGLLLIFIKPSFAFGFIPLLPFFVLLTYGLSRELLDALKISVLLIFCIIFQSMILRVYPDEFYKSFKVVFHPFYLYGTLASHFKIMLEGVFLGWVFCLLYLKKVFRSQTLLFTVALVLSGYFIAFLFYDVRDGMTFPDMTWQSSIYGYLFLLVAPSLAWKFENYRLGWRFLLLLLILGGHAFHGLFYLLHCSRIGLFYFY